MRSTSDCSFVVVQIITTVTLNIAMVGNDQ